MNQIYLEIENLDSLILFLREARNNGMLKDVLPSEVRAGLSEKIFPMRIPIETDAIVKVATNPIIRRTFGKKMEDTTRRYLVEAMET